MIRIFALKLLLITLFNFNSFAEEVHVFNFTKDQVEEIKDEVSLTSGHDYKTSSVT